MRKGFQFTLISLKVSKIFILDGHQKHWNYEIARTIGSAPNVTQQVLKALETQGYIRSTKERISRALDTGRVPRRFYSLTDVGSQVMGAALLALQLSTFHTAISAVVVSSADTQRRASAIASST